jgi:hypothetical protein
MELPRHIRVQFTLWIFELMGTVSVTTSLIVAELMLVIEPLSTTEIGPNLVPPPPPHPATQTISDVTTIMSAIDASARIRGIVAGCSFRLEPRFFMAQTDFKRFILCLAEHGHACSL